MQAHINLYSLYSRMKKRTLELLLQKKPQSKISQGFVGQMCLMDSSMILPFVLTQEMIQIAQNVPSGTYLQKARSLYDILVSRVVYGTKKYPRNVGYRNSREVLEQGEGICGEMTYLYVAMARYLGIRSHSVYVDIDYAGKKVHHACAGIVETSIPLLVDIAYKQFNAKHKRYRVLSDLETTQLYQNWRKKPPISFL